MFKARTKNIIAHLPSALIAHGIFKSAEKIYDSWRNPKSDNSESAQQAEMANKTIIEIHDVKSKR